MMPSDVRLRIDPISKTNMPKQVLAFDGKHYGHSSALESTISDRKKINLRSSVESNLMIKDLLKNGRATKQARADKTYFTKQASSGMLQESESAGFTQPL